MSVVRKTNAARSALRVAGHAAVVVSLALAMGAAANSLSPRRIAWVEGWASKVESKARQEHLGVVGLNEVREIVRSQSHLILDARDASHFEAAHIPGAISLPLDAREEVFPSVQLLLRSGKPILVYCSGQHCDESLNLGRFLKEQGYADVSLFVGGMSVWQEQGEPIESDRSGQ